jgi:hypothetical protein
MPSAALSADTVPAQLYGRLTPNARHMRPCGNGRSCWARLVGEARTGRLRTAHLVWVKGLVGLLRVQMGQSAAFCRITRGGAPQISGQ